jgi:uncharacterized protein YjbI with pentapeptide repeats
MEDRGCALRAAVQSRLVRDRNQELLDQFPWLRHRAIITAGMTDERFDVPRGAAGWWVDGGTFERVDFSGLDLDGFSAIGAEFSECDFSRTKLKHNVTLGLIHLADGGDQRPTIYRRCVFDRADLISSRGTPTVLGAARFEDCNFARARISGWRSENAEFVGCRFEGQLRSCQFHGRDPDLAFHEDGPPLERPTNAFANNDFREADLVDCEFAGGIDVTQQHWPSDPDYIIVRDVQAALGRVNSAIDAMDDAEQKATARAAIDLRFRLVDPLVQTTQVVRLSDLRADGDARIAQSLARALKAPDS